MFLKNIDKQIIKCLYEEAGTNFWVAKKLKLPENLIMYHTKKLTKYKILSVLNTSTKKLYSVNKRFVRNEDNKLVVRLEFIIG